MKSKNYGRVEKEERLWDKIEAEWLDLYLYKRSVEGMSAVRNVTADDEWCFEAYMETDYSKLTQADFDKVVRNYVAYHIQNSTQQH